MCQFLSTSPLAGVMMNIRFDRFLCAVWCSFSLVSQSIGTALYHSGFSLSSILTSQGCPQCEAKIILRGKHDRNVHFYWVSISFRGFLFRFCVPARFASPFICHERGVGLPLWGYFIPHFSSSGSDEEMRRRRTWGLADLKVGQGGEQQQGRTAETKEWGLQSRQWGKEAPSGNWRKTSLEIWV